MPKFEILIVGITICGLSAYPFVANAVNYFAGKFERFPMIAIVWSIVFGIGCTLTLIGSY